MNLLLIVVLLVLLLKVFEGYKRGMVKEIFSFISLVLLCIVVTLVTIALDSFMDGEVIGIIVSVVLLIGIGIAHNFMGIVFFPAKLISKLPVIHWVDKLLGVIAGALETILLVWTLYLFVMRFGLGMIGQQIVEYTQNSAVLSWLYHYNMLAALMEGIFDKFSFL